MGASSSPLWPPAGLLLGALAACRAQELPPLPSPLEPEADGCVVDPDNALRLLCEIERDGTGPVEVVLEDPSGETASFPGDEDAPSVRIVAWDLRAQTEYAYQIVDRGRVVRSGALVTPTVPGSFQPHVTVLADGPTRIDRVLFPFACDDGPAMILLDAEGRLRWYQPVGPLGSVSGFDWTGRSVVTTLGRRRIFEVSPSGETLVDLSTDAGLEHYVHHGVIGDGDRILALDTEAVPFPDGETYLMDGVTAIDRATGRTSRPWDISALLDPTGLPSADGLYWSGQFPEGVDFAHENSIALADDGGWILSFKHLDTVVRLDPDLAVRWALTGRPNAAVLDAPPLALSSSRGLDPSFAHQHHANLSPWGTLLLVDNGDGPETTRILELELDEEARTADVIAAWDLGVSCPVQSSAYGLPDGTILASCARTREVFELDGTGIRRRIRLTCPDDSEGASFVRAQPVSPVPWSRR